MYCLVARSDVVAVPFVRACVVVGPHWPVFACQCVPVCAHLGRQRWNISNSRSKSRRRSRSRSIPSSKSSIPSSKSSIAFRGYTTSTVCRSLLQRAPSLSGATIIRKEDWFPICSGSRQWSRILTRVDFREHPQRFSRRSNRRVSCNGFIVRDNIRCTPIAAGVLKRSYDTNLVLARQAVTPTAAYTC